MNELLFEIGTEEIPAGYIQPALNALAANITEKLKALGLAFEGLRTLGTPRRLTLSIAQLQTRQEDRHCEYIGPSSKAGLDAKGQFTKAAIGFARSKGVEPEQLQRVQTEKGEYLMVTEDVPGKETRDLLPSLLEALVRELVFPKSMRWANLSLSFARPIQWLLALYGGKGLSLQMEGIVSGEVTRGHRFLAPQTFAVKDLASYLEGLAEHYVQPDFTRRREMVVEEVRRAVQSEVSVERAHPVFDESLLDTVCNLVEYPFGICGRFDAKFLELPDEVLITSMREHQKYFPVAGSDGKLLPFFVAVNNTCIADRNLATNGHERVLRARLEDALFFFNEDRKRSLADCCEELQGIVFQQKLGTMGEKTTRITRLAESLAAKLAPAQQAEVKRAAQLSKADLLTAMVGEFPTLQGVMGRVYAMHDGEKPGVPQALEEHYLPVRSGGEVPQSLTGALVGIADRMDTLAGCFAIGEKPTGNKDAFGLRRQAIGLIAILRSLKLPLSLRETATAAFAGYEGVVAWTPELLEELLAFIRLRFENEQIAGGLPQELVEAASSVAFDDVVDCRQRIEALDQIRSQESFRVLAGSFKRIKNIIKDNAATTVDAALLGETAEQQLFAALTAARQEALPLLDKKAYHQALLVLLVMKEPLDAFFEQVMVMAEDQAVRQNRLNLLTALGALILRVGDISRMHAERE